MPVVFIDNVISSDKIRKGAERDELKAYESALREIRSFVESREPFDCTALSDAVCEVADFETQRRQLEKQIEELGAEKQQLTHALSETRARQERAEQDVKTLQGYLEESSANDIQQYEQEIEEKSELLRKKEMEIEELTLRLRDQNSVNVARQIIENEESEEYERPQREKDLRTATIEYVNLVWPKLRPKLEKFQRKCSIF